MYKLRWVKEIIVRAIKYLADKGIGNLPFARQLLKKIVSCLLFPSYQIVEFSFDPNFTPIKMAIFPRRSILERDFLFLNRVYEKEVVRLFCEIVKPGMTVLDVGAHIGYHTLIAARLVGSQGRVYSFEPEPSNFAQLSKNVELNGLDNVTLVQKAISNKSGREKLYLDEIDSRDHFFSKKERAKNFIQVATTTLDDFCREERVIEKIALSILSFTKRS